MTAIKGNKITQIRKRDNRIVPFEEEKITKAVLAAISASGEIEDEKKALKAAQKVTERVVASLNKKFHERSIPAVEEVQDIVEEELIKSRLIKTAKAYILYREQHARIRDMQTTLIDSDELIEGYIKQVDWRVKENSNMAFSLQGLNNHVASAVSSHYWLNKIYPREVREAHANADLHLHDLQILAAYCCGWDLKDVLLRGFGGASGKVESKPAKHFRVALGQVVNFFYTLQGETAGAQAFSSFDTLLAPFIRYDGLSYKDVKQCLQEFLFNMNVPTRVGFQCLSEDTEILTPEGWASSEDIKTGDIIKTFNLRTKKIENQRVSSVFKRHYKGKMYNLKNRIQDQLISPGHRVVRKVFQSDKYTLEPIEEVLKLSTPLVIPVINDLKNRSEMKIRHTYIKQIRKVNYEGVIWCPHTKNETIIARRNGKIFITGNTPFTNITMDLVPNKYMAEEGVIIGGLPQKETYKEFQAETDMLNRAFAEVMLEGDAKGRVFTFPIPTYNITRDFNWENPVLDSVWEMTAKYGVPYFSNFINSDMKPEDARSMCCRLRIDNRELRRKGGGLFGANPLTGSIGVVTVNLPRIGYLAKTKEHFFNRLARLMDIARTSLEIKREVIEKFTVSGLYPYSKFYLSGIKERFGQYWKNHFNTIGVNGMNEAALNFLGPDKSLATPAGHDFAREVLDFMRERLGKYQEETNQLYNLEATPAEGTSYRFARKDKELYPDIICANEAAYRAKKIDPYYTNSTHLPVNYTDDIFEALKLQDDLQTRYTGGTVLHGFLGERMSSAEATKHLVKKIAENFHLPYYTLTPTFSVCPKHGYLAGEHFFCPKCDEEIGYTEDLKAAQASCQTCK